MGTTTNETVCIRSNFVSYLFDLSNEGLVVFLHGLYGPSDSQLQTRAFFKVGVGSWGRQHSIKKNFVGDIGEIPLHTLKM